MTTPADQSGPSEQPLQRVSILGLGQMGLVCSALLTDGRPGAARPAAIRMWGHDADEMGSLAQTRGSPRLPGFTLPQAVEIATEDNNGFDTAQGRADLIVVAVPTQSIREALTRLKPHIPAHAAVVSVAKGIENGTLMRPSQIIADVLADDPDARPRPIGCLSGPTIAEELSRRLPATMIAAADEPGFANNLQALFSSDWMRVYTNDDLLGVELAGALKNVIAIAAGVLDGLQAGANAKSALLARGLAEITRMGAAMGANPATFAGIAGVGDLATTCFSPSGRNRACGEALGRGQNVKTYLGAATSVVEGVATTRSAVELAERYRVDMPITEAVASVLFEGVDPVTAIDQLMRRSLKDEITP